MKRLSTWFDPRTRRRPSGRSDTFSNEQAIGGRWPDKAAKGATGTHHSPNNDQLAIVAQIINERR
jgi:hypothetical protein